MERRPVEAPGVLDGLTGVPLTADGRTGSSSWLVELPAAWRGEVDGRDGDLEVFVLDGDLGFEGDRAGCGAYLHVPQLSSGGEARSERGALALAFWNPDLPSYPPPFTVPRLTRSWAEPWVPTIPGSHGVMHKSLRQPDPQTETFDGGPGGFVRLFLVAPGVADPQQHVHHECWEEVFTLTGDVFMADQGITPTGTVLSNPQEHWHGPFASHRGAVLLVQSDGPMGAPWPHRDHPGGMPMVADYMDRSSWLAEPPHADWPDVEQRAMVDDEERRRWEAENPRFGDAEGPGAQSRWRSTWRRRHGAGPG